MPDITMDDIDRTPDTLVLAVEGKRLSEPPKEDSPEAWPKFLELSIKSPLVYGTLVTLASMIHTQKWEIVGGSHSSDIEQLFKNSGFDDWKFELIMELMLIGNSFIELVTPPNSKKLDKLVKIEDPTTIDIKKDGFQYALDPYGQPIAYIQNTGTDMIEIPAERIAHLKLFRWPARVFGVGLVEPVYNYEKARIDVISNITLFSERLNRPLFLITTSGPLSDTQALTAAQKEQILTALRTLKVSGALFLGGPFEVNTISANLSSSWVPLLKFLTGEVMAGLGIPQALLFAELRTTPGLVRSQEKLFQNRVDTLIARIEEEFNRTIVHKLDPNSHFKIERPTPLYIKEVVEALAELARAGTLTPDVVDSMLRNLWSEFPSNPMYTYQPIGSEGSESTGNEAEGNEEAES